MFGFYLKKSFCDGWDNLFTLIIVNLVFMFAGFALFFAYSFLVRLVPESASASNLLAILFVILLIFLIFLLYAVVSLSFGELAVQMADYCGAPLVDFFKKIPSVIKDALLFALLGTAILVVSYVCITWYFSQGIMSGQKGLIYFFLGGIFFWADIIVLLAFQWFVPIRATMHNDFKKCLKKCFILTLDNTAFTIGMGIYGIVMLLLSILAIGFIPSIAGITLAQVDALKLRMYKYDYLEQHPELTGRARKNIPWEELIFDDREALGPRKLKNFLFPWKDGQNLEK